MYLRTDYPITRADDDRLERRHLARHVANRIGSYSGEHSLMVGVSGPWGSGKSSFVNMVYEALSGTQSGQTGPVVRFVPWTLANRDTIAADLFRTVGEALKTPEQGAAVQKLGSGLAVLGDLMGLAKYVPSGSSISEWGDLISRLGEAAKAGGAVATDAAARLRRELSEQHERVKTTLRTRSSALVVVLEDLDRLPAEQVQDMFRVLCGTADLPNTVYVLVMDREKVAQALDPMFGGRGHDFVEKFLHLEFRIPQPSEATWREFVVHQLNTMLAACYPEGTAKTEEQHFWGAWHAGLGGLFRHPRDVIRVLNSFDLSAASVGEETNWVDLLAVEAMRRAVPDLLPRLLEAREALLGSKHILDRDGGRERHQRVWNSLLESLPAPEREAIKGVLRCLFPAAGGSTWGGNAEDDHRRKRICSSDHLFHFFSMHISADALSEREMWQRIDGLLAAKDDSELAVWTKRYEGHTGMFADKLRNYVSVMDQTRRTQLAMSLARAAHLAAEQAKSVFLRSDRNSLVGAAYALLRGQPEASWGARLVEASRGTEHLYGLVLLVAHFATTEGSAELGVLSPRRRGEFVRRVEARLDIGAYDHHDDLEGILYRLRDVSGSDVSVRKYAKRLCRRNAAATLALLERLVMLGNVWHGPLTDDDRVGNRLREVSGIFDVEALIGWLRRVGRAADYKPGFAVWAADYLESASKVKR